MVEVERIADWKGQDVVDRDGEKIGKLEEVYSEVGRNEPAIGAVKTGVIGRGRHLVPLTGASLGRGYIRVTVTKDEVKAAPTVDSSGQMTREEEIAYAGHYGLPEPARGDPDSPRYESSSVTQSRHEAMAADMRRAEEMEAEAARLGTAADEAQQQATTAAEQAEHSRQEQQRLLGEAGEIRAAIAAADPSQPAQPSQPPQQPPQPQPPPAPPAS